MRFRRFNYGRFFLVLFISFSVCSLGVGFAVFNTYVTLKSRINVIPETVGLSAKFSTNSDSLNEGTIYSSYNGSNGLVINNSLLGYPTIANIGVNSLGSGDTATYNFYVLNNGSVDVYLTDIIYKDISDGVKCQIGQSNGCNGVTLSLSVSTDINVNSTSSFTNHLLKAGKSETVTLSISNSGSSSVDVSFGNIQFIYKINDVASSSGNNTSYDVYHIGDVITYGNEKFYVIEESMSNRSSVLAITEKNIDVSSYTQSTSAVSTIFDSNSYNYNGSSIETYVNNYVGYINSRYNINTTGRLLTYNDALSLGCNNGSCNNYSWLTSTSYWLNGSSDNKVYGIKNDGSIATYTYDSDNGLGIRPVISIAKSQIPTSNS